MIKSGIYVHLPFCRHKCHYCDFYSLAGAEDLIPHFLSALKQDINLSVASVNGWEFDSIYLGGGTPSLISADRLEPLLKQLHSRYSFADEVETTIEVNPGTVDEKQLRNYRAIGINRISIGAQSFLDDNLRFLTRIHDAGESINAVKAARAAGFDDLSCDLIYGLPGQTRAAWKKELQQAVDLAPDHLSCYNLTVEAGTELHDLVQAGKVSQPEDDTNADFFLTTVEYLDRHDYRQYEISNYARPGCESRHNLHYWRIEPYLGFGPSAHSFDGRRRWWNRNRLENYLETIAADTPPVKGLEILTDVELTNERIGFGLRMREGFNLNAIAENHRSLVEKNLAQAQIRFGDKINVEDKRVMLSAEGRLFAEQVAVELMIEG